jgi:hypothetical protein
LILSPTNPFHRILVHDWVLDRNAANRRIEQALKHGSAVVKLRPSRGIRVEPAYSRVAEISTRRMGNHKIPPVIKDFGDIAFNVFAGSFRR